MARWSRHYFIIKTGNETLGFLSLAVPEAETGIFNFTLHRPELAHTDDEFMDLTYTTIDKAEWETHINAFETHKPLEVDHRIWTTSASMGIDVLLTKKE